MPAHTPSTATRLFTVAMAVAVIGISVTAPGAALGAESDDVAAGDVAAGDVAAGHIAAGASVRDIEVGPVLRRSENWTYGERVVHDQPTDRTVPISADGAAAVQIDTASLRETGMTAYSSGVDCTRGGVEQHFTEEQWNSPNLSERTMDVGTDALALTCASGDGPAPGFGNGWTANWVLTRVAGAPNPATLGSADQLTSHWVELEYGSLITLEQPRTPMREGEQIRLVGAPGTWPSDTEESPLTWWDFVDEDFVRLDDATVSEDGTALAFAVPMRRLTENETRIGSVQARSTAHERGIPWNTTHAVWTAGVLLTDGRLPTATRIALSNSITLSVRPIRVTAVVSATSEQVPPGSVSFLVDGREVQRVDLPAGPQARVTVTLPNLRRGVHNVVAVYNGGADHESSTSSTRRVRVLF